MSDWTQRFENYETIPDWLAARRNSIGGSEVPIILGESSWATPLQLWARRVGLEEEQGDSLALRLGHHMEPFIVEEFARETQLSTMWMELAIVRHPEFPDLHYSPDAAVHVDDEWRPLEAKNRTHFAKADWGEDVPRDVWLQVQHGLDVTGTRYAYVAALVGRELRWAKVPRDDDHIEATRPVLLDFMRRIREEDPPEATVGDREVLVRMYPEEEPGKTVALPPEVLDWHEQLREVSECRLALSKTESGLKAKIQQAMGDAEQGILPAGAGHYQLKVEPRAEHVVKASRPRVLRFKKPKGEK